MPKARKKKKEDKDDAEWTQGPSKPKAGSRNKKSCVIHCTNSSGDLVRLQSIESWKVVLRAATIREHDAILKISAIETVEMFLLIRKIYNELRKRKW